MPTRRLTGDTELAPGNGVCNDGQSIFERTIDEGTVPVFTDHETRNITKGATGNGVPFVSNATHTPKVVSAGVVMPWSDRPGRFDNPGKSQH